MISNKTFQLKLSHLIIGGILLFLLIYLVKCDVKKPDQTDKYDKQKQEITKLNNQITLLKFGQKVLNKQLDQQKHLVDSLNIEINVVTHYFFVPSRILWKDFPEFINGGEDGLSEILAPMLSKLPVKPNSLADYLGLPIS